MTSRLTAISSSREAGFTLVELMITVAIIGVLAAVAVPAYKKFLEKSRQAEPRLMLGAIYIAEQAFAAESSSYTMCLAQAGFEPQGVKRYYTVGGWNSSGLSTCGPDGTQTCAAFSWPPGPALPLTCDLSGGATLPYAMTSGGTRNDSTFRATLWENDVLRVSGQANGGPAGNWEVNDKGHYKFIAFGSVSDSAVWDIWEIDQDKQILNPQSGL